MLRFFMFGAIVLALASAFFLYAINYSTRRISIDVAEKQKHKAKLISRISVLKAERAYLSRAERIGPAALRLGMHPAVGSQITDRLPQSPRGAAGGGAN
jgi:cell division protein FtsL